MRDADAVCCVKFKAVVALDAVCLVYCVGRVYQVYYTHCAVSNLALTVRQVSSCWYASLLSIRHCQVKSTYTQVANVILQTHVTIRDVARIWHTLCASICKVTR